MAGLGGIVSGLFGSDNEASFHMDPTKVDPNAYQYGGQVGGAAAASNAYGREAQNAQGRLGAQLDTTDMQQSRAQQQGALDLQRQAAMGNAPSAAALQQKQGLEAAMLAQQSAAASARGPAALAGAQYQANANMAAQQQAGVNQAAQLRAQEMATARDQYGQMAAGMRGQDFQQSMGQAQLDAQQRALNDQYSLGMTGYQFGVNQSQLNAQMQQQAQQSQNDLGAQALNLRAAQGADQQNSSNAQFGIGTIAGLAAMSDERAKTDIQPEGGGVIGYSIPQGVGVSREEATPGGAFGAKYGADPSIAPYLGVMSMNGTALGSMGAGPSSSSNAPSPPKPDTLSAAPKKADASSLQSILGMAGAGGGADASPAQSGMQVGSSLGGAMSKLFSSGGGGAGAAAGAEGVMSDERAKMGVHPAEGAAPAQMLDHVRPVSFNYKPGLGQDSNHRQYGVIAQDLAKTPMGASTLVQRPDGLLAIDVPKATTANLAAAANLNERVRALEHGGGGRGGGLGVSALTRKKGGR